MHKACFSCARIIFTNLPELIHSNECFFSLNVHSEGFMFCLMMLPLHKDFGNYFLGIANWILIREL